MALITGRRSWTQDVFRKQVDRDAEDRARRDKLNAIAEDIARQRRGLSPAIADTISRQIEQRQREKEIASEYMDVMVLDESPSTMPYVPPKTVRVAKPKPPAPYVPLKYTPSPAVLDGHLGDDLRAYAEVAQQVGVLPDELKVELLKDYLRSQTYPVYDLGTVVSFMDAKSKAEGRGWGWKWVPLRSKDHLESARSFGREARRSDWDDGKGTPASDHYQRLDAQFRRDADPYDKVVPLHALQKVAKIESDLSGQLDVKFMVSDYETAPAFRPDPFLLAVIDSPLLQRGQARFVIDVWDEPGFGLEQSLKSGV